MSLHVQKRADIIQTDKSGHVFKGISGRVLIKA
jgi:hypothetical protein